MLTGIIQMLEERFVSQSERLAPPAVALTLSLTACCSSFRKARRATTRREPSPDTALRCASAVRATVLHSDRCLRLY